MNRSNRFAVLTLCILSAPALSGRSGAQTIVGVNPRATYLFRNVGDRFSSLDTVPIDLLGLGISGGQTLRLQRLGGFSTFVGDPDDTRTNMVGVFSTSSTLLAEDQRFRVPGAVGPPAGVSPFGTFPTLAGEPTDIPEDFFIGNLTLQVPLSARFLFVATPDGGTGDNSDPNGNFAVRVTNLSVPEPNVYALLGAVMLPGAMLLYRRRRAA